MNTPIINRTKFCSLYLLVVLFSVLFTNKSIAQEYIIKRADFEGDPDSAWVLRDSKAVEKQAYRGLKSLEVLGRGEASCLLVLPKGIKEIVVKGWIKLSGASAKNSKQIDSLNNNYVANDTVYVTQRNYKAASILIQGITNETSATLFTLRGGQVGSLYRDGTWTYFEKEMKVPTGVSRIFITCRNTYDKAFAYFDEISVEERQIGFVEEESSWAKSVRLFNEKAKLLVKNGDFEDGAQIWNPYWGFELSKVSHSGNYSCMIQNPDSGAWRGSANDRLFKIPPGTKKLRVSAWIKAENVIGGPNPWETGAMLLSLCDASGNEIPGGEAVARTVGTHDWRKYETYFPISERATNFKILLQLGASTGKIYFDDIVADAMTEEEFYKANSKVKNPGFEELLAGWPAYAGEATKELAHTGTYCLKVASDKIGWDMRHQTVSILKDKKEFNFSIWIKTVNVTETTNQVEGARVYIEFKDINGIVMSTESVGRVVGTSEWQEYFSKIKIPDEAVELTIYCGRANASGSAYFDDALLEYPEAK